MGEPGKNRREDNPVLLFQKKRKTHLTRKRNPELLSINSYRSSIRDDETTVTIDNRDSFLGSLPLFFFSKRKRREKGHMKEKEKRMHTVQGINEKVCITEEDPAAGQKIMKRQPSLIGSSSRETREIKEEKRKKKKPENENEEETDLEGP